MSLLAKSSPTGIAERFWSKVDRRTPDECWPWRATVDWYGYGQFWLDYSMEQAHRVSWWLAHGPIPEGLCVCHHCDNPGCVNPAHLFLGTRADNNTDKARKGRQSAKLAEEAVQSIREEYTTTTSLTQKELGRKYGVGQQAISNIVNRRTWEHVK